MDISAFKPDSPSASGGGALGATTFNTVVSTLSIGGKSGYLIDKSSLSTHQYSGTILSSCTGAKKCLFKSPTTGDDIEVNVFYNTPGKKDFSGGPDSFDPGAAGYKEALRIANTLAL